MNPGVITLITVSVLILNSILGLIVFARNPKSALNRSFGGMVFLLVGWLLTNYLVDKSTSISSALTLTKATNIFATLAAFFFLYFCVEFTRIKQKIKRVDLYLLVLGIISGITSTFVLFGYVVKDVFFKNGIYEIVSGSLINYHLLYFIIVFALGLSVLIYSFFTLSSSLAQQLKFMIFGLGLFIVTALILSSIIPLFINDYKTVALAPISSIFFVAFTSYAIVRHRLMDIRMVVARSVAYAILLAALAGFYAGSVLGLERLLFPEQYQQFNLAQGTLRTVIAVIMVFLFQPLRRWITRVTDKIFFKNQYDPEQLLDTLAHTIGSSIVLIELVYKTLDLLLAQMKITRGIMVILTEGGNIYTSQYAGYKESPNIVAHDMERLSKDGTLIYDELSESSRSKALLRKYDAAVAIPLKTDKKLEGLLLLGEKSSGDMFSQTDLKVFEIIAPELAVAITNAKAYEKIERFNITLRQEVKRATGELEHKNEQLRELDRAKDEFISMASHQLRTPLTAIKGYLSMLLEGDAGEIKVSQYDFVNEAFSGANRMVGLINDLLNVSRMETGRFFLEPVEVDMEKLINEEVKQLAHHAKEKHLDLKFEVKDKKIPHIWADETKIRQVVMNFIDNALYYTTKGGVTVTLEKEKEKVVFKVKDTGIGVPKGAQKQLFTKFYRADNARHVRPDGTGLGIYLAKRVVDDHGGQLIFHSEEGKGSIFGFKFPLKSRLKIKRLTAPAPSSKTNENGTPPIGEIAAGIGVSPATLEATKAGNGTQNPPAAATKLMAEAEIARDSQK